MSTRVIHLKGRVQIRRADHTRATVVGEHAFDVDAIGVVVARVPPIEVLRNRHRPPRVTVAGCGAGDETGAVDLERSPERIHRGARAQPSMVNEVESADMAWHRTPGPVDELVRVP